VEIIYINTIFTNDKIGNENSAIIILIPPYLD